jgi:hypothetical protein
MMERGLLEVVWGFVRGDSAVEVFERWVYEAPELEQALGKDLYLAAISTDFADEDAVRKLRGALAEYARARSGPGCLCIRLRSLDVVDMGSFQAPQPAFEADRTWSHEDVFRTLDRVKERGPPRWWLWAARCRVCGQGWLVGQEERQNDVFCMKRLAPDRLRELVEDGRWPTDFDRYETLLRLGADAGRSVRFVDPLASSMSTTVVELATARPGISVRELAGLLAVDVELARELARRAVEATGVRITFDV